MIRIRSKHEGFRRCGQPHPAEWTDYPDDFWSKEQLEILDHEPMLQVEFVEDAPHPGPLPEGEGEELLPHYRTLRGRDPQALPEGEGEELPSPAPIDDTPGVSPDEPSPSGRGQGEGDSKPKPKKGK